MSELVNAAIEFISIKATNTPLSTKLNTDLNSFCSIGVDFLHRVGALEFDVYIGISNNKIVKIHKKGDLFTATDTQKYKDKNITKLHILKSDGKDYLNKSLLLINASISASTALSDLHIKVSKNTYELLIGLYEDTHCGEQALNAIGLLIDATAQALNQNTTAHQALQVLWKHPHSYITDHSISLAYIATTLATTLGWSSTLTHTKLVAAAMLHDIPLKTDILAKIQSEEELLESRSSLENDDIQLWMSHSRLAVELANSIGGLPSDLSDIILYHHETPHTLMARSAKASDVPPLAALFSIAHSILVKAITAQNKNVDINTYIKQLPDYYGHGHFGVITRELKARVIN